jgi:hypothetical protein
LPGKDFLALLLKVGFHRAGLDRYTGFKSSAYTEGALFYGEKLVDQKAEKVIESLMAGVEEPKRTECPPSSSG